MLSWELIKEKTKNSLSCTWGLRYLSQLPHLLSSLGDCSGIQQPRSIDDSIRRIILKAGIQKTNTMRNSPFANYFEQITVLSQPLG